MIAVYWPGLSGGFVFDDYPNIVSQARVHLTDLSWRGLWDAAFAYHPGGGLPRPISNVTFALNYWADGLNPIGYKWTNLLIHLANCLLLGIWLRQVLLAARIQPRQAATTAATIALLWAIHPLQVSAVLYVVQRMELLCLSFMLASLIAYTAARTAQIKGTRSGWGALLLALLFAGLAFAAKETGALTALYGLALEWLVFRRRAASPQWARFWTLALWSGTLLVLAAICLTFHVYMTPTAYVTRDFGPEERLLSQLEIVPFYLGQILLPRPDRMLFFYDGMVAPRIVTPTIVAGGLLLLALVVAMFAFARRLPLLSLGIAIFLISHAITSSPIPLELVFEHRNYFAIAGVLLAVAALMLLALPLLQPRVPLMIVAVVVLGFATLTSLRSASWGSPYALAAYSAQINPRSTRAAMDLAEQYMLAARKDAHSPYYPLALAEFERAAALPQGTIMGEHGLLMMAADFGIAARPEWWQSMRRKLSTPPVRPQDAEAVVGMVEHRQSGLPLDDAELSSTTLTLARTQPLAPEMLFLFAQQALLDNDNGNKAEELYARGLIATGNDLQYREKARQGIARQVNAAFLARVDETFQRLGPQP